MKCMVRIIAPLNWKLTYNAKEREDTKCAFPLCFTYFQDHLCGD